ncbi:YbaB/EbfC family nucleoid-associated protein [Nocardia sp. SYP-A9097]|uniref:YbaB/EbfC family nucleoid-associated protein n=1 Tax=Nocardia sp. SYP-A9097 TaxID=2663237 RepID=UPI001891B5FA|nr:YbaB/EbfC family nucleoid-associated protein [Nocardia sp. SYP-A9097]
MAGNGSNERLKTEVAQVLDDVHQLINGFADARRRYGALTATASVERERIIVTVDASGAVTAVDFAENVDDLGYTLIARGTVRAAQQAASEVKLRADELLAPLRAAQARLPVLADLIPGMPREPQVAPPPPALLTPPGERDAGLAPEPACDDPAAEIVRLQDRRAELYGTGAAEGRRVLAAVNADGVLIDLKFSSGIGDLDFDEIADAVTAASRAAVAEVARMVTALFAPLLRTDAAYPGPAATLAGIEQLRDQLR